MAEKLAIILTEEHWRILRFAKSPKKRKEILEDCLGLSNHTANFKNNVKLLLDEKLLERTIPDKPKNKHQKYVTNAFGRYVLKLEGRF